MARRPAWPARLLLALVAAVTLTLAAFRPLEGDDAYVVDNLRSAGWRRHLFAFDYDAPSADYVSWWAGEVFQRRFVRVPSSALLWCQWKLFGLEAAPYHLVTLGLVAASCLVVHALARRYLPPLPAFVVALVPAVHPASAEVVGALNTQPVAVAGLFAVIGAADWERMRRTGSRLSYARALGFAFLAMISYEAAVVLPLALLLADAVAARSWRGLAEPRRLGLLALLAPYTWLALAVRRGLYAPESGPLRPLDEVWTSARLDATAYVIKTFGIFDPRSAKTYLVHRVAGEPWAIVLALLLLVGVLLAVRRSRVGWLGLAVFALLLLAPWLTRATVSKLNFSTFRQLYLPVLLGGPLVLAACWDGEPARARRLARGCAAVALVALAVQAFLMGRLQIGVIAQRRLAAALPRILATIPAGDTIVTVGDSMCRESPSLFVPNASLYAVPVTADDEAPLLTVVDAHTLVARVARGVLDIPVRVQLPARSADDERGPDWNVVRPPPLVEAGTQRIPGATVSLEQRSDRGVEALRYRFDRPLAELSFLRLHDCDPPERIIVATP